MPKSFFPIPDKKFQSDTQKNLGVGGSPSLFHMIQILYRTYFYIFTISRNNRIQSHLLLSLPFFRVHLGKFNYWNQSSNWNVMHKDDVKFPNFSHNAAYLPNSMDSGPTLKKRCDSPGTVIMCTNGSPIVKLFH